MLFNVSELREFVMEARMLAEVTWDAKSAFAKPDAANRFVDWWSREYFGDKAAVDAARAYRGYYQVLPSWDQIAVGGNAERPPFEKWYRRSWIRDDNSPYNVHRSYQRTLAFLIAHYLTP